MSYSFRLIVIVAVCMSLLACWKLPGNFATLPLQEKVEAYQNRFQRGGARSFQAEDLIIAHGYEATEAMVPYISRKKSGITPFVAVTIVWKVQLRGCDLRGSAAERAIQELLQNPGIQSNVKTAAEAAVESIVHNLHADLSAEPIPREACKPSSVHRYRGRR